MNDQLRLVPSNRGSDFDSGDGPTLCCPLLLHRLASIRRRWRTHLICRPHIPTHRLW